MPVHTFDRNALDTFKASWPCHGLPDKLNKLTFEFASNGDLVDMEARARNGRLLDTHEFDGPALVALAEDAKEGETPVIFRFSEGEVIAVFPGQREGNGLMGCYAHIGQHSTCSMAWYRRTRPARPDEYAQLKKELERAPYCYRLKVSRRIERWMTATA